MHAAMCSQWGMSGKCMQLCDLNVGISGKCLYARSGPFPFCWLVPGDFVVHQTLLQGVGQPLVHQWVANEGSAFPQRCLELQHRWTQRSEVQFFLWPSKCWQYNHCPSPRERRGECQQYVIPVVVKRFLLRIATMPYLYSTARQWSRHTGHNSWLQLTAHSVRLGFGANTNAGIDTHTHTHTHTQHRNSHTQRQTRRLTVTPLHSHSHTQTLTYARTHAHTHTHTHTHSHAHMHVHTHTAHFSPF